MLQWKATYTWSLSHLRSALSSHKVNVAVTPHGNADSPTLNEDGNLVFVKPWEEPELFPEFIDYVSQQELHGRREGEEIRYAQTRQYQPHLSIVYTPMVMIYRSNSV